MRRMMAIGCCCCMLACGSPQGPVTPDDPVYYPHPDSAWKVLSNLRYAYLSRDLEIYESCFRDDFEFLLPESLWADYSIPPDGVVDTCWGLEMELLLAENLFDSSPGIELNFTGGSDSVWSGDPTGQTWDLTRDFDLQIHAESDSASAFGSEEFLVRPDSSGDYYIWRWWDYSDEDSPYSWTELKGGIPEGPGDSLYYSYPDSAWKAVHNLVSAYNGMDLDRYLSCFDVGFEFWFQLEYSPGPEQQWDFWGLETEAGFHEGMFDTASGIELALETGAEFPSDSFPGGAELLCPFDLKVYVDPAHTMGYRATGDALFTLVEDSSGVWTIARWRDLSTIKMAFEASTWADIKQAF